MVSQPRRLVLWLVHWHRHPLQAPEHRSLPSRRFLPQSDDEGKFSWNHAEMSIVTRRHLRVTRAGPTLRGIAPSTARQTSSGAS